MAKHDFGGLGHERHARENTVPDLGVRAHDQPFVLRQWPLLEQDSVRDADLADVVQQRVPVNLAQTSCLALS